jgi:hypothetical protein
MDLIAVYSLIFLASLVLAFALRRRPKGDGVQAQFVVTGTLILITYIVCLCSGVCTILNFLFRWVF